MVSMRRLVMALVISTGLLAGVGCGADYIRDDQIYKDDIDFRIDDDSQIEDTLENREVLDVLASYRKAVVTKDFGTLKRLISPNYYDNAGTTNTTEDDYSASDLAEVFEMMAQGAREIRYDVLVRDVKVKGERATVDYKFDYAYKYVIADESSWDAGVDVNRLELEREDGVWRIVSGL
ncbi:SnoaL-like protein [Bradymonas sediminis]|nr:SnoaL-like protein [Bradymonas sediminis]